MKSKKQNTSLIIKAVMLLLALIVMVFVASLAWFAPPDRPVTAEGLSVNTSTDKSFDMAVGFETSVNGYQYMISQYGKTINLQEVIVPNEKNTFNVLHDFSPIDVTGDGVTLVRPAMVGKNKDIDRNNHTYTTVTPNKEYISFDMYFRADETCKVYLDSGSFAKGVCEDIPGDGGLLSDTVRKSDKGNFSKDAVVGAVRVSFVDYDEFKEDKDYDNLSDQARLLWLPRPDIHLNTKDENGKDLDVWNLSPNVQPEQIYDDFGRALTAVESADTYTHHYYTYIFDETIGESGGYRGEDRNYEPTVTDPKGKSICDVNVNIGDYYYGKVKVNIWIEGCDAEARRAIAGGQFQVNFDLSAGS